MNTEKLKDLINALRLEYVEAAREKKPIPRWIADYNKEIQEISQYRGREVLELLQNADDAKSNKVEICMDTNDNTLTITNSGEGTLPFSIEGVRSIMCANMSPKGKGKIGAKGLGFRSILNWADEISIVSDNVRIDFHPKYAEAFWMDSLSQYVEEKEGYEKKAAKDGRTVPLSLLALPEFTVCEPKSATSIILKYQKSNEAKIKRDLHDFQPYSLLFLHNIKNVSILIDGQLLGDYRCKEIEAEENTRIVELANDKWVIKENTGSVEINNKSGDSVDYEVACAFNLSAQTKQEYPIYSFFPTRVRFHLPCILHATLNLDSSRYSIVPDNEENYLMMDKLTEVVAEMADYLKESDVSWFPYQLMRPQIPPFENSYESYLYKSLNNHSGDYVPLVGGGYGSGFKSYYLSDRVYDMIKDSEDGKRIFNDMRLRLPKDITGFGLTKPNKEIIRSIEEYASTLKDIRSHARFLCALVSYSYQCEEEFTCRVFIDNTGEPIKGKAYINEGQTVEYLPSFLNFEYLNSELVQELISLLEIKSGHPERERSLAGKLSRIGDVSASDITSITRHLLPKSSDMSRPERELIELLKALFRLYLKRRNEFSKTNFQDVWIPTESDSQKWKRADRLVIADARFPDGFRNLNITSFDYMKEDCALFPSYLLDIDGSSPYDIQNFLLALGANLYFTVDKRFYGDDRGYLDCLPLTVEIRNNCSWKDKERDKKNQAEIANETLMATLSLNDLVRLIKVSGYQTSVCGEQKINWFDRTYKTPQSVSLSYAAYLLSRKSEAKWLKYYSVIEREWLPGLKPANVFPFEEDHDTERILYALGAVRSWSDFSAELLYEALKTKTAEWKRTGNLSGAKSFYHNIKLAFNRKPNLDPPAELELACRIGGECKFLPADMVYYSDNMGVKELRDKLPVLEMSSREGEEIVKRVFGCRLFKELKIHLHEFTSNQSLTNELGGRIEKLKPYILAMASKNAGANGGNSDNLIREITNTLKGFSIRVVENATYEYQGATNISSNLIHMKQGDLQYFGNTPTLCSNKRNIADLLSDPRSCSAVLEALCISLKLSSSENFDRFHRLLKSTDKELEFFVSQEINDDVWQNCCSAFQISEEDINFWKEVFARAGKESSFNASMLKEDKKGYLTEMLCIPIELTSVRNFLSYHKQNLKRIRDNYSLHYVAQLYSDLATKEESSQREFITMKKMFLSEGWIEKLLEIVKWDINPDYMSAVGNYCHDFFDFDIKEKQSDVVEVPAIHEEYLLGHDKHELYLSEYDESLLYFEGKEEYFKRLIQGLYPDDMTVNEEFSLETEDTIDSIPPSIRVIETVEPSVNYKEKRRPYATRLKKPSEKTRKKNGENAEQMVLSALKAINSEYEVGTIYSEFLAKEENKIGDDSKGYDLEYKRKGESLYRCLEIKHCSSGQEIIVSRNEYETALKPENIDRYDIALVTKDEILIWRNAFMDKTKYSISAEELHVKFNVK